MKHPVDCRGMDEAGKTTEILEDQLCTRGVCESAVRESAVCGRVAGESVAWERVAWEGIVCVWKRGVSDKILCERLPCPTDVSK